MYLGPTFASFENLGIETGQVLAMLTDALMLCLGFRLMYSVISHQPRPGLVSALLHSTSFSPNIKWYLLSISASVTRTSEEF